MILAPTDTSAEFSVSYEGSAVDQFTMPIRDLAPALLALGEAFDRANELLNGSSTSVSLEIRATQQGSFEIVLILQQLFHQATTFFSGDFVSSAANMKELFFTGSIGGSVGLFALIRRLRGVKPEAVSESKDLVTFSARNIQFSVPADVFRLYSDYTLRQRMEAFVKPVSNEGIDRVVVKDGGQPIETVERSDIDSFRTEDVFSSVGPDQREIIISGQRLRVTSINFNEKTKWLLNDGDKTRWYSILDDDFFKEVNERKHHFASGDILVGDVSFVQSLNASGELIARDYAIRKVLRHDNAPEQAALPEQPPLID